MSFKIEPIEPLEPLDPIEPLDPVDPIELNDIKNFHIDLCNNNKFYDKINVVKFDYVLRNFKNFEPLLKKTSMTTGANLKDILIIIMKPY